MLEQQETSEAVLAVEEWDLAVEQQSCTMGRSVAVG